MNLVSLFSGVGGLDEGLHEAGFAPVFCSEIDKYARSTLERFLEDQDCTPWVNDDINSIESSAVAETLNLPDNVPLLLAGGPPCQSFSLIGARGSVEDPRGQLIFKMVEYAYFLKPHVVLMEQVKGLLSAALPGGGKGSVLQLLIDSFREIGYGVDYKVLNAADYGMPQLRERLFLVASKFPG
jgi:DNA (cytosine-5)-methyltransferase 1